jgi:hypothetical protein
MEGGNHRAAKREAHPSNAWIRAGRADGQGGPPCLWFTCHQAGKNVQLLTHTSGIGGVSIESLHCPSGRVNIRAEANEPRQNRGRRFPNTPDPTPSNPHRLRPSQRPSAKPSASSGSASRDGRADAGTLRGESSSPPLGSSRLTLPAGDREVQRRPGATSGKLSSLVNESGSSVATGNA